MFFAQIVPGSSKEVLLLPLFLSFFGALAWIIGVRSVEMGRRGWERLLALALFALAIFNGVQKVWALYQPGLGYIYRASLSRMLFVSHFVSLLMPLLLFVGLYVWSLSRRRQQFDRE
jgi:hypothetical protein